MKSCVRILMVGLRCMQLPIGLKGRLANYWRTPMSTWTSRTVSARRPLTSLTLTSCDYLRSWRRNRTIAAKTGQIFTMRMCTWKPADGEIISGLISVHLSLVPQPLPDWGRAAEGMSVYSSRMSHCQLSRSGSQNPKVSLPWLDNNDPVIVSYPKLVK